ncbi:MAG: hypothetical protein LBJ72_11870 [Dysgonamonadaceae bacterium]|jgi:hypothetical protein|nr:hypothetical protein [Dysgonamonadaceae bacterium]
MENYNHFTYGEMLARALKPIRHTDIDKHFYQAIEVEDLPDLDERLSDAHGVNLIAIDGSNSDFIYKNPEAFLKRPQYFFIIVAQTDSTDIQTVLAAQKQCETVAEQIISKMLCDFHEYVSGLHALDPETFTIRGYGPIADNFYGVILGFNMSQPKPYKIDQTMWIWD